MAADPIEGPVFVHAAAKASVPPDRLARLLEDLQADLADRRDRYADGYERVHADDDREVYLVEPGHWEAIGEDRELARREVDAIRRAHREQLLRVGRSAGRAAEFEAALDIREPVVIGR